ncbi:MAG: hypothetical protein QME94_03285 [Anaerolineae bacterium]|nr:hypothetical protein [Anaerolineae bacterium]
MLGWQPVWPWPASVGDLFIWIAQTVAFVLVVVSLGTVVVLLVPGPTRTVAEALTGWPAQSVGAGLVVALIAAVVLPFLVVICIGIPVAVVAAAALATGLLFGWIAVGQALGQRIFESLKLPSQQPVAAAALGLLILASLTALPVLGTVVGATVGAWGLGAVVVTRGGSLPYTGGWPSWIVGPRATG